MSKNPFSHVDLRVRSFANVTDFYRALLPELGFTMWWGEEGEWRGASTEESFPGKAFFGLYRGSKASAKRDLYRVLGQQTRRRRFGNARMSGSSSLPGAGKMHGLFSAGQAKDWHSRP
jgi:hypothetical protein